MEKHLQGVDIDKMISQVSDQLKDTELITSAPDKKKDNSRFNQCIQANLNSDKADNDSQEHIHKVKSKYDEVFSMEMQSNSSNDIKKTSSLTPSELKKVNEIKRTDSFQKDEYLQLKDWDYIDPSNLSRIETQFNSLSSLIANTELYQLVTAIQKCNLNKAGANPAIGALSSLQFLIESQFFYDVTQVELMTLHMSQLDRMIFKWRNIKGDGNCFYRSVIFSFLEKLILSKNVFLLKEITIDLNERFTDMKEYNVFPSLKDSINKLNTNLIVRILYLILEAIDSNQPVLSPIEILVKCFLFCNQFDLGMVFYLRCLLYDYIKANKNKIYSTDFSVKIGNLLPAEYETQEGAFLYNLFFEENLLKMDVDAEKISIYLTPFALRCDLNVVIYEFDSEDAVTLMGFPCYLTNKPKIEVLYRKTHYDLIYSKEYFNENAKSVNYFVNSKDIEQPTEINQNPTTLTQSQTQLYQSQASLLNKVSQLKVDQPNPPIGKGQCSFCSIDYDNKNILNTCRDCLTAELSNLIFGFYLQYLAQIKQMRNETKCNYRQLFDSYFRQINCIINNKKLLLTKAIEISKANLLVIIKQMKKKLCVQCQNEIKSSASIWFELPCDCLLCSKACFKAYFEELMEKDLAYCIDHKLHCLIFNSCLCGYQLNNNDYSRLYLQFEKNDMKKLKKTLKKVILINLKQNCMLCLRSRSQSEVIHQVILKDEKITEIYKEKEFFHIICDGCLESIGKAKKIECCLCNSKHTVVKYKQLTGKNDDDCRIF